MNTCHPLHHISLVVLALLLVFLLPKPIQAADPAPTLISPTLISPTLIYGGQKPVQVIGVTDATVNIVGAAWWGTVDTAIFDTTPTATAMVALTTLGSYIEATCAQPTSTVGVQFLGDQNDGWAKIIVDGEPWWQGNTQGATLVNDDYIEISGLPAKTHRIQVETMVTPESDQVGHITVVALGCGPLTTTGGASPAADRAGTADGANSLPSIIYLPTIMS